MIIKEGSTLATEELLLKGYSRLYELTAIAKCIALEHIDKSPDRIVRAIFEMFSGCYENPDSVLTTTFKDNYDEIVYCNDISFVSMCAHHNMCFFGKVHFGYLPDGQIVGLSKIPRLVRIYSRRPQVQEKLTQDIVDKFNEKITPKDCGIVIEAYHFCCSVRGIESVPMYTKTAALRGTFKTNESTKQEFLNGIRKTTNTIWP